VAAPSGCGAGARCGGGGWSRCAQQRVSSSSSPSPRIEGTL